ncbi:UDP-N-acetylmuramoyl-L-alanyl-D-glutamate--2,6-diaminopimelate ligase [bacterium]|nr:UDP-N-acetylmuramoyl-L-alanyl-D-glutamate--2,6-diaminopimelate ligase [bacterium]
MKLSRLISCLEEKEVSGSLEVQVKGIASDSRKVRPGYLFISIKGFESNGHRFIEKAVRGGASCLIVEEEVKSSLPVVRVPNSRRAAGLLAARFYGYPAKRLRLIGITGTNGKTTTTYLIESILKEAGLKVGRLSTTEYRIGEKIFKAAHTTPDAVLLQRLFAYALAKGVTHLVMEVSSHALSLERIAGCDFAYGVFTNLSHDHLDFHKNMEDYFSSKLRLFDGSVLVEKAIINIDDPYGRRIAEKTKAKVIPYQLSIINYQLSIVNCQLSIEGVPVHLKLPGRHNLYNALAASMVALGEGIEPQAIKDGLETIEFVPGRFQLVSCGQPFKVVVDYAHTPEALKNVLSLCRELKPKRIITLFGCGGDRDRKKRPIMGKLASQMSDLVIITSDNPRSEEPGDIIKEIEEGIKDKRSCLVIVDRKKAIAKALSLAKEDDLVLIAGKGHEDYQILKDRTIPFDDRKIAKEILGQITDDGQYSDF